MGKSTNYSDATKSEFSKLGQLLIQTADEAAFCLKALKSNLAEYDTRHGLFFLNTAKSYMRSDIRATKDMASELRHVADQIDKSETPSESEITAARSKIHAVSDAMIDLKKKARAYDRKNSLDDTSETSSVSEMSLSSVKTESEGSYIGDENRGESNAHSGIVRAADTVEAVVRLTLRHNFSGFSAVKHQIGLAEESLSPSFAESVMDTMASLTSSLKGEEKFASEGKQTKSLSV
ncbi:hypothetical protein PRIC1_003707 [Phytophthora ramorum]|nr:hypothetical protein KRP23_3463 [Phytophthora ramorum]KAH7508210.1 hypothetical protein KRP22_3300 [Phytophthora ramorum]